MVASSTPPRKKGRNQYIAGQKADPIGPVVDFRGGHYFAGNSGPCPITVITGQGSIGGRSFGPSCVRSLEPKHSRARTGACVDASGRLLAIIAVGHPPGMDLTDFEDCMSNNCPEHSHLVLLDGGDSTQVVRNGNPPRRYPGFEQQRAVLDWIVICN